MKRPRWPGGTGGAVGGAAGMVTAGGGAACVTARGASVRGPTDSGGVDGAAGAGGVDGSTTGTGSGGTASLARGARDPETQPLMMRLKSDLLEVMLAVADGKLDQVQLQWDPRPALAVVATSKGYPGKYATGVPITGVDDADAMRDVKVFHSGTALAGGKFVTDGGRVLSVTALGNTIAEAQKKAYRAMDLIHFEGMHYRRDIGDKALKND